MGSPSAVPNETTCIKSLGRGSNAIARGVLMLEAFT